MNIKGGGSIGQGNNSTSNGNQNQLGGIRSNFRTPQNVSNSSNLKELPGINNG
jgi:hypothetical protein